MRALTLIVLLTAVLQAGEFEEKVLPVLRANCMPCHDARTHSSGFAATDLASVLKGGARFGVAVSPGAPEKSPLYLLVTGKKQPKMPMDKELSAESLSAIENWIRTGAEEIRAALPRQKKYWAYEKPARTAEPPVKDGMWIRNAVDRFILAKLESRGLRPSSEANRRTLIRRVYFDLIGLPPSPEEVQQFVETTDPGAYEKLVDKLLMDPRYGERWGRHWLDLARYSDTNGYEGDTEYFHAWRYRDYVVDSLNSDKPYDQFVMEQIAGDEWTRVRGLAVPAADPEKVVALTFLRLAPFNRTPQSDENRDSVLSEITSTVSAAFLGLTVGCAKCHDHKYDQIPQKDFYRMKAFFETMQIPGSERVGGSEPAAFFKPGQKEWAEKERARTSAELESVRKEFSALEKALVERLSAHRSKPATAADVKALVVEELNNTLSLDRKDDIFNAGERALYRNLSDHMSWSEKTLTRLEPRAWAVHNADGPPFGPIVPVTHVQIRGDYDRLGEPVEPGFPSCLTGTSEPAALELDPYRMFPTHGRRMTLARWIASADNPLFARVMVNRLWHHHFGVGIVETTSDFGRNGSPPSHPELLDWLAVRFIEERWSLKAMHRLMMNSASYRQASDRVDELAEKVDSENRLLWRFSPRRLEGEAIRDSILAVSGRLNPERGGLPVYPAMPKDLDPSRIKGVDTWETSHEPDTLKRSLYTFQRRSLNFALLETLDAPVPNATCDRRRSSVTALQALALYNGQFVNEESRHFAARLRKEAGPDAREQIERAFLLAFGRKPSAREKERLLKLMESNKDPGEAAVGLGRVVLNSNEFVYVD